MNSTVEISISVRPVSNSIDTRTALHRIGVLLSIRANDPCERLISMRNMFATLTHSNRCKLTATTHLVGAIETEMFSVYDFDVDYDGGDDDGADDYYY